MLPIGSQPQMFFWLVTRSYQFDSDSGSKFMRQGNLQQILKKLKTVGRWFEFNHSF